MEGKDILIIVGLVLGLLVVASTSFTMTPKENTGLTTKPYTPTTYSGAGGGTYAGSGLTKEQEEAYEKQRIEMEIRNAEAEVKILEKKIEEIQKYGEPSPYKGMVTIASAGNAWSTDPKTEYIELSAGTSVGSGVNISEWTLVSAMTGRSVTIGKAVHVIFAGQVNADEPVFLRPGDRAYGVTGRSPVGYSFLTNKCTGYFAQFQTFTPFLWSECPLPQNEIIDYYDEDKTIFIDNRCMDLIESIGMCRILTGPIPLYISSACQEAIAEEVNYNACVRKHKNDVNFRGKEWRIYFKRDDELWRDRRELIKLLDENGKTVHYFSY